jgi:hypothetical protein
MVGRDHLVVRICAIELIAVRTQARRADAIAQGNKTFVQLRVIARHNGQIVRGAAGHGSALAVVPVLDNGLRDLSRRVVRDGSGHDILLRLRVVLRRGVTRRLGQLAEYVPVRF